jgi:two-component system, LytTR family, response regulator
MKNNTSIRCLVVDDEPLAVKLLAQYISQTPGLELVMKTTHAKQALEKSLAGDVDIIFLDIQMPELSGLEIMEIIRNDCRVVLTTAYPQYALKGFEYDAIDYLLKPITYERFLLAIEKAKERLTPGQQIMRNKPDHIFIKSGHRIHRIDFDSIFYIESLRDYIAFHTSKGKILSLENMKDMESMLPSSVFIRIHKSYIINKPKIDFFEKWKITINGQCLPVGDTYRSKVITELKVNS